MSKVAPIIHKMIDVKVRSIFHKKKCSHMAGESGEKKSDFRRYFQSVATSVDYFLTITTTCAGGHYWLLVFATARPNRQRERECPQRT